MFVVLVKKGRDKNEGYKIVGTSARGKKPFAFIVFGLFDDAAVLFRQLLSNQLTGDLTPVSRLTGLSSM